MKTRLLTALVIATAIMQGIILYRQFVPPTPPPATADAPAGISVELAGFPQRGASTARMVLIEFSDFQCPYCARHATAVLPDLIKEYVARGEVRYALANLPLAMHSNARWLARVAMCAGEQGRYWEMHEALFAAQQDTKPELAALAEPLKLDQTVLHDCVEAERPDHDQIIKRDTELAEKLGFAGTPAFAVGRVEQGNTIRIVKIIRGAVPFKAFAQVLDELSDEG